MAKKIYRVWVEVEEENLETEEFTQDSDPRIIIETDSMSDAETTKTMIADFVDALRGV